MFDGRHSLSFRVAGFVLVQNGILAALFFALVDDPTLLTVLGTAAILVVLTLVAVAFARKLEAALKAIATTTSHIVAGDPVLPQEPFIRCDEIDIIVGGLEEISRNNLIRLMEDDDKRQRQASSIQEVHVNDGNAARAQAETLTMVLETLDGGLRRLAAGDLTVRLEMSFPEEFEGVRADFNHGLTALEDTLERIGSGSHILHAACTSTRKALEDAAKAGTRQTAAITETAGSLTSLAHTLQARKMQAEHVCDIAHNAQLDLHRPKEALHSASGAMATIREASTDLEAATATIREIAFQANILALNNSMEAARAGKTEDRFQTAAEEIRRLAERAAEAAKEVSALARKSAEASELGSKSVDKAVSELDAVMVYTEALRTHVGIIATGSAKEIEAVSGTSTTLMALAKASRDQVTTLDILTAGIGAMGREIGAIDHTASRYAPVTIVVPGGVTIPQSAKPVKKGAHLRLVKS